MSDGRSRLERPWLVWATVATILGLGGNVELISERIIDTNYKLSFDFFHVRNRTLIKMFWYFFENKQ